MSAPINDGGPAFPSHQACSSWQCRKPSAGMTLRDYFAAAALKGQAHRLASPYEHRDILAADCYAIADAMLKARECK
jgi:hypothetical protein